MLSVYKYPIPIDDEFTLELPRGAGVILTVQTQQNEPFLWALVDPGAPVTKRRFRLAGTGHPLPDESFDWIYIGTFQLHGGGLVFHLWEVDDA